MPDPGDVVTVDFVGATGVKRRPAVVVSNDEYHNERPDVILGLITSNIQSATGSFDHVLSNWQAAGLRKASAFRAYFGMARDSDVHVIGRMSDSDWNEIRERVRRALA